MREIADKVGALLMCDMSHPAGLIAKGLLNNPMEYCHIVRIPQRPQESHNETLFCFEVTFTLQKFKLK